ncbi:hypothetical protein ACFWVT_09235 [Streptomyces cyaneofuscatus]|uniref:hypothetical protein n=1 Tax=Streptomyces cyaneofuscatus TaxID=66883 RepID=UPI003657741B
MRRQENGTELRRIIPEPLTNLRVPQQDGIGTLSRFAVLTPAVDSLVAIVGDLGAPARQNPVQDLFHDLGAGHDLTVCAVVGLAGGADERASRAQICQVQKVGELTASPLDIDVHPSIIPAATDIAPPVSDPGVHPPRHPESDLAPPTRTIPGQPESLPAGAGCASRRNITSACGAAQRHTVSPGTSLRPGEAECWRPGEQLRVLKLWLLGWLKGV